MATTTKTKPIKVLLAESNPVTVRLFRKRLADAEDARFNLTCLGKLDEIASHLDKNRYDAVVLDPVLPGSQEFDAFLSVRMHAQNVPVILLLELNNEDLAVRALQDGAQDCLIKEQLDGLAVSRIIRYAIERHRLMADLEQAREKEYQLAYFDTLTGLPNRQLFYDRLQQVMSQADRYNQKTALMYIDLDGFKKVNDTMGHNIGDLLLQTVAKRLECCLRKSDTVARLGGDEFTCILPNIERQKDVNVVARKILDSLVKPFKVKGHKISISGSIGISLYPDDTMDLHNLIKNADIAMYDAKKKGRNNFQFFVKKQAALTAKHMPLENSLRKAVKNSKYKEPDFGPWRLAKKKEQRTKTV